MRATPFLSLFFCGPACAEVSFERAETFSAGDISPDTMLEADLNADGLGDLIVGGCSVSLVGFCISSRLVVLLAEEGGFRPPRIISEGELQLESISPSLAVGDFNNDEIWDLVAISSRSGVEPQKGSVALFLGEGDGTFTLHEEINVGFGLRTVAAADVNNDSALDLLVTAAGRLSPPDWLPLHSEVLVLLGGGDGSFSSHKRSRAGPDPRLVDIRDLDGDAVLDLVTLNGIYTEGALQKSASVLLGEGDGTFDAAQVIPLGSTEFKDGVLGDLNGDGRLDLILAAVLQQDGVPLHTGAVVTFIAAPNGTLQRAEELPVGQNALSLALGDLDQDGALDLVSPSCALAVTRQGDVFCEGSVALWMGDGEGDFTYVKSFPLTSGYPREVLVNDANGDGWLDILTSQTSYSSEGSSGSISVLIQRAPR